MIILRSDNRHISRCSSTLLNANVRFVSSAESAVDKGQEKDYSKTTRLENKSFNDRSLTR